MYLTPIHAPLFCSVLEFGPVPTPPTPLFQGAPVRLFAPKGVPPLNQWDGSQLLPARCYCAGSRGDRYVRWGCCNVMVCACALWWWWSVSSARISRPQPPLPVSACRALSPPFP